MSSIKARSLATLPTATGEISRLAYTRLRKAGIAGRPLLKCAGLTYHQIKDRKTRVGVGRQIAFLNLAAASLGDELLGFHLARSPDLREFGLLYYVAASSETLGEALKRTARYCTIANEGVSVECSSSRDCRVAFRYVGVARQQDRHQMEYFVTALVRLCRQLTGSRLKPKSLKLRHAREGAAGEFDKFVGAKINFSSHLDELVFGKGSCDVKVVSADPYLNKLLVASCEQALVHRPAGGRSFRTVVEKAIAPLLPHGKARATQIAHGLGLSQRTLARRLEREAITFSELLEHMRRDLAGSYLGNRDLSISRIAWLLGFREVSAFSHAFKRWTGKTPRQMRGV